MTNASRTDWLLEIVGMLRGFALSGLFLVHMIESYELDWAHFTPGPVSNTVYLLFMGKSFSLLALCFGFSFFILMDRAARRGVDFSMRFAWRLTILLGIGTFHALVYRGDVIQLLAAMGFLLLLFNRIRDNRVLIAAAVLCFAQPMLLAQLVAAIQGVPWGQQTPHHWIDPAMDTYITGGFADYLNANMGRGQSTKWWFMYESGRVSQILGLYLIGMVLGRTGFFARLDDFARARWIALGVAIAAALALHFGRDSLHALAVQNWGEAPGRVVGYLSGSWYELSGTVIWLLVLVAIYQSAARALFRPLAAMGRLTLTLYVGQSLVFVPIFYGFGLGLHDDWGQATRLSVGLAAIMVQIILARLWLRHLSYGPLEWVWRASTYRTLSIPLRRVAVPVAG